MVKEVGNPYTVIDFANSLEVLSSQHCCGLGEVGNFLLTDCPTKEQVHRCALKLRKACNDTRYAMMLATINQLQKDMGMDKVLEAAKFKLVAQNRNLNTHSMNYVYIASRNRGRF